MAGEQEEIVKLWKAVGRLQNEVDTLKEIMDGFAQTIIILRKLEYQRNKSK
jgi:hypothetical protein